MNAVLVTGAGGFIGGYVVSEFLRRGWRVFALVHRRRSERLDALAAAHPELTILSGDVADARSLASVLDTATAGARRPPDAIVHCAGRASDVGRWRLFRRANVDPLAHLADLMQRVPVGRLVFLSTTDVYGLRDAHGEEEDALPLQARPRNPYPLSKIAAEAVIRSRLPADRYVILRPAQVWGVGDTTLTARIVGFLRASPWIVHFGPWRGRNRWPHAHVRNVAAACALAAVRPEGAGRAINVVDNEHTSIDGFYRLLAAVYLPHRRFGAITLPRAAGVAIGWPISAVSTLLGLRHPFADPSHYAAYAVSHNLDFGNRRLRELFAAAGEEQLTLQSGLDELAAALPPRRGA